METSSTLRNRPSSDTPDQMSAYSGVFSTYCRSKTAWQGSFEVDA
jgi:hypothetical protein